MSLFSLSWFKSNKEEPKIEKKENDLSIKLTFKGDEKVDRKELYIAGVDRPYKKVKLVNDVLTVILNDGCVVSKCNSTHEEFLKVRTSATEKELLGFMTSDTGKNEFKKLEQQHAYEQVMFEKVAALINHEDFEIKDNSIYLKGVDRSIPELLVTEFARVINEEHTDAYNSLKNFWLKCCLNPNAQSAEDLYKFLSHHQFKIDKHGNFYAYRRVVKIRTDDNTELVEFIANAYNKVKAVWKKRPVDHVVYEINKEYHVTSIVGFAKVTSNFEIKNYGNLKELYLGLDKMVGNRYTDDHTRSYDYRVGQVISMPRHHGNDDNSVSCSKGFHAASKEYDYSGFGDTPILVIINPIDVLAVPLNEEGKLRMCRWFFATTLPEDEQYILDDEEFDVTDLGDIFEEKCMEGLTEYVQNSFAEEVQRHTFNIPKLTAGELSSIVTSLEQMQEVISKRINVIK